MRDLLIVILNSGWTHKIIRHLIRFYADEHSNETADIHPVMFVIKCRLAQLQKIITGNGLYERGQLDQTYHAYICENQFLTIRCPIGYIIRIIEANFGRQGSTHCRGRHADQLCYTAWTIQELGSHCYWRQKCTVFASTKIFGDPCTDVDKYLSLSYQCESTSGR
ncbi:unnamed protein product [Mytilus edulis]|uniref:SUEL-type lectin domain-containing protein n=1 Tax=Mytilus edulis TaxID=6550 RepID=A0A8S3Q2V2_MYTED|nr:unnamed protein product [Mytilus edulis]